MVRVAIYGFVYTKERMGHSLSHFDSREWVQIKQLLKQVETFFANRFLQLDKYR